MTSEHGFVGLLEKSTCANRHSSILHFFALEKSEGLAPSIKPIILTEGRVLGGFSGESPNERQLRLHLNCVCHFLCFLVGISYWTNCKPTSCWYSWKSSPLGSLFSCCFVPCVRWFHRQDVAIIQTSPERRGKGGSNCWCPGGREVVTQTWIDRLWKLVDFTIFFFGCISLIHIYLNLDTVYVFIFRCSMYINIYTYI